MKTIWIIGFVAVLGLGVWWNFSDKKEPKQELNQEQEIEVPEASQNNEIVIPPDLEGSLEKEKTLSGGPLDLKSENKTLDSFEYPKGGGDFWSKGKQPDSQLNEGSPPEYYQPPAPPDTPPDYQMPDEFPSPPPFQGGGYEDTPDPPPTFYEAEPEGRYGEDNPTAPPDDEDIPPQVLEEDYD